MHIHKYERIWLVLGGMILVAFLLILGSYAFIVGTTPPSHLETVDAQTVRTTPPFDKPGLYKVGPNEYEAVMLGFTFGFAPNKMTIPLGATVHFLVTTPDVVHGLYIPNTNINMMLVPGHVNRFTHTFDKPGEYLILCHEYCGIGHQAMFATITVNDKKTA